MIKLFEKYNEYSKVKAWLDEMCIKNYTINDDLTVDVSWDVNLHNEGLSEIPIQFGKVRSFDCSTNALTSLKGAPREVSNSFKCDSNLLTSLEGAPLHIPGPFNCDFNKLTNLEGAPQYVGGGFYCSYNKLTSLIGGPRHVSLNFWAQNNKITGLKYLPDNIPRGIFIENNSLPEEVLHLNDIKMVIKYQEEYGIWNPDSSFNKGRWKFFIKDYTAGILT